MHRKASFFTLMAMFSLASISAFGQAGEKAKVKGMISSRAGETFTVKTAQGNVTVVLTDSTKTKDNKGLLGARSEKLARETLIPGLKVDVDGTFDSRRQVVATVITVDGDDLETSQAIQAGLTPTAKQVATNSERIDALERRLVAVEGMASAASTQAPASSPDSVSTPVAASTPAPAPTRAPAPDQTATAPPAASPAAVAEPVSAPLEAPKTSLNVLRVGLTLLVVCCIGLVAVRRAARGA